MISPLSALLGPCAHISALWRLPKNSRISHLPCHCFISTLWLGGVVREVPNVRGVPNVGQVVFGHYFNPVRKLHPFAPTLSENHVFMCRIEDKRVEYFPSIRVENLVHHLEVKSFRGWEGTLGRSALL